MGNYDSREIQLKSETLKMFNKLIEQKSVTKKDLISLSRKFRNLKEINQNQFGNLANRAKNIMRVSTGLSITSNFAKLHELYADFKEKI